MEPGDFEKLTRGLNPLVNEQFKYRLITVLFGGVAFYTLPISILFVVFAVTEAMSGTSTLRVLDVVKIIPVFALGIGGVTGAVIFNRKAKDAKEQAIFDAQRRQKMLEKNGDANEKARRIAGLVTPVGQPTRVQSAHVTAPPASSGMTVERAASRVRCTWCGKHVSVAQADEASGEASCASCGNRFSMREEMLSHMGMRKKPLGLDASVVANTCTIVHPTGTIFSYLVPIISFALLVLTLPEALQTKRFEIIGVITAFIVVTTVVTAAFKSRKTVYTITPETFIVGIHGILGRDIGQWDKGDVEQIFVREKKHTRKETDTRYGRSSNKRRKVTYYTYDVILLDAAGRETRLSAGLDSREHALYIEQEIENRFAIVDRKMGGGPSR